MKESLLASVSADNSDLMVPGSQRRALEALENIDCPYCGKTEATQLYVISGFTSDPRKYRVVQCANCLLIYINPRCSRRENFEVYQENYFVEETVDLSGQVRSFFADKERKIKDHKVEFEYLRKHKNSGRILDFGSGPAYFFEVVEGEWEKHALDISRFAIDNITHPDINKFCGEFAEARYPDDFFDVIHIRHTLDRLINIRETVSELKRTLKKDGIIFITLPNIDSLCAKVFNDKFRLLYSNHLVYFSPRTLAKYFEEVGLKIKDVKFFFYKTSYFSYSGVFKGVGTILLQVFFDLFGVRKRLVSPPFWGNVMSVVIKAKP